MNRTTIVSAASALTQQQTALGLSHALTDLRAELETVTERLYDLTDSATQGADHDSEHAASVALDKLAGHLLDANAALSELAGKLVTVHAVQGRVKAATNTRAA